MAPRLDNLKQDGVEWIRDHWRWTQIISLDRALADLRARAYSFTRTVPADVRATTIDTLESELKRRFQSLAAKVEIPSQVYLVIILRR